MYIILCFKDLIYLQKCLFLLQIKQGAFFSGLKYVLTVVLKIRITQHNEWLDIRSKKTDKYGKQSA